MITNRCPYLEANPAGLEAGPGGLLHPIGQLDIAVVPDGLEVGGPGAGVGEGGLLDGHQGSQGPQVQVELFGDLSVGDEGDQLGGKLDVLGLQGQEVTGWVLGGHQAAGHGSGGQSSLERLRRKC